jgi:hypothetical protein
VDALLRGFPLPPEIRSRDAEGRIHVEQAKPNPKARAESEFRIENNSLGGPRRAPLRSSPASASTASLPTGNQTTATTEVPRSPLQPVRVYPYGVARDRLVQAPAWVFGTVAGMPGRALRLAHLLLPQAVMQAEQRHADLRADNTGLMEQFLSRPVQLSEVIPASELEFGQGAGMAAISCPQRRRCDRRPSSQYAACHELCDAELVSHSYGKNPEGTGSSGINRVANHRRRPKPSRQPKCVPDTWRRKNPMFITLEGPEGSGKTSHLPHLVEFLRSKGHTVFPTREPGGTSIGEQIRSVLHSLENAEMNPRTETLLYQAARASLWNRWCVRTCRLARS